MARDLLARVEVLREQGGRHDERAARVHEPFARRAIDGELAGRFQRIQPCQVADRIGVFRIAEPTEHDRTRVAGIRPGLHLQVAAHPALESFTFRGGGLLRPSGRHLAAVDHLADALPGLCVLPDVGQRGERHEVEVRLGPLGRVALLTVLLRPAAGPPRRIDPRAHPGPNLSARRRLRVAGTGRFPRPRIPRGRARSRVSGSSRHPCLVPQTVRMSLSRTRQVAHRRRASEADCVEPRLVEGELK